MKKMWAMFCVALMLGCTQKNVVLSGEYKMQNAPENAEVSIVFDGNSFAGQSAVNRYFGTFEQSSENIKFNVNGTTMMMGPQSLMLFEQEYIKNLSQINKIEQNKNVLTLKNDNKEIYTFIKTK